MKKIALFILLLGLSSCMRLQEFPVRGSFPGIKQNLECKKTANLLIIHGVGGYSDGDPETLINSVRHKLNLQQVGQTVVRRIIRDNQLYGCLSYTDYRGISCPYHLRIYNLYWHPATKTPRNILQAIDRQNASHRLPLISEIKETNVNGAAADAILYVSSYRQEIQYPFQKTIEWIEQERKGQDIIVVGFSLGSTMLIDTLDELKDNNSVQNFIKNTKEIFMLSNPSPLFELSKLDPKVISRSWDWRIWAVGRFVNEKRKYNPNFQIVAISDPNDVLSYVVKDYYIPAGCGRKNAFLNEEVRNVKWSLFGFVNPIDAHTGYGKNEKVLNMIIFGNR